MKPPVMTCSGHMKITTKIIPAKLVLVYGDEHIKYTYLYNKSISCKDYTTKNTHDLF